jgi:hypothetical protein
MKMSDLPLKPAIERASLHWANRLGWSVHEVIQRCESTANLTIAPHDRSFAAKGEAAKITRGLIALRAALQHRPSRQWLQAWKK